MINVLLFVCVCFVFLFLCLHVCEISNTTRFQSIDITISRNEIGSILSSQINLPFWDVKQPGSGASTLGGGGDKKIRAFLNPPFFLF